MVPKRFPPWKPRPCPPRPSRYSLGGMRGEPKPDWKDFLALVLAAYSLLLPPLLAVLGALLLFTLLLGLLR
ncbi:methylmalonyl-CoA mutase [Thermus thermophilus HB27]|nr:methylmalonyl-CoA mutase [Thermus thermophilus HB27]